MIDKSASIIPGVSLGGIHLGTSLSDLGDDVRLISKHYGIYFYEIGSCISISVDCISGLILKISAHRGYKGLLYGQYALGMSINPLLDNCEWKFDDVFWDGVMVPVNGDKVYISSLEDPDFEELCDSEIEEITVFL
ncbi:hypothetical protein VSS37_14120 [Candidatus Thiothrix sp. Deng01]|uniref:Uncharacterized protein n=1 Tax=Candidatus Thiothrix phosphatis TaxID=3112415 RepID=A0ABU6CZ57_9GAMM|nr:hypothetical protein [Candidatus Thiothrix sp. Deng01]MEB4592123.1 hypothetical protein [Candidatus Thiothrix sp. Deng01]